MNQINSIIIEGMIVQDPRLVAEAGADGDWGCLVKFDIANHRRYKNREGELMDEATFMQVQAWGDLADKCLANLKKGMSVRVVGRMRLSKWLNKDNEERKNLEILAQHIEYRMRRTERGKGDRGNIAVIESDDGAKNAGEPRIVYEF